MLGSVVQGRTEAMRRGATEARQAPREWIDVSLHSERTLRLPPDEVAEMNAAVDEVLERYTTRSPERDAAADDVPGVVRVRVHYDAFPLLADDA